MDLVGGVNEDRELMKLAVKEAKDRGLRLAKAEAEYQSRKHIRALQLKSDGHSATMVQLILKGDPDVCEALFERDCAQVEYDSAVEAINAYKLSARLLEAQIQREWNQAGGTL